MPSMTRRLEIWGLGCSVLAWLGCGGAGQRGTDSSTAGSSTGAATDVGTGTSNSTTSLDDTHETTSGDSTGMVFLPTPDAGGSFECDIFEQDCPPGEKCTVWASDGGQWDSTKCERIVDEPAGVDEPCQTQGWPTSGSDDCDLGMICLNIDPVTLEGICMPFCTGDASNPECADPGRVCVVGGDGAIAVCRRICSPLLQDCPAAHACYPIQESWLCAPDGSGDQGAYGDSCWFINACDPGLICLNDDAVPPGQPCEGTGNCCTEACDLTDPLGDLQCSGAAEGQTCQPWYQGGEAPQGLEDVGACVLPV